MSYGVPDRDVTTWDVNTWDDELIWSDAYTTIEKEIKKPHTYVFRKLYIKRRQLSDGLFESDWYEISDDVKRWGEVSSEIDYRRFGKLQFNGFNITVQNVEGRYNPDTNTDSLWYGYGNQQRTLVKIECGFYHQYRTSDGRWVNDPVPNDPTIFVGIISGNINVSSANEVVLPIQPLTQVFYDYPSHLIDGFSASGITASKFMELVRDQTDGSSNFVFRPFFGNDQNNFLITATSIVYSNLNTSTASDLYDMSVWDVMEKLGESEQHIPYILPTGEFKWRSKDVASTSSYSFFGTGITPNTEYGRTIKNILSYGKKYTSFYSRVAVKYTEENTNTSFVNTGLAFAISGSNTAWNLGYRTFSIENFWIPNSTVAASVASYVFDQVSSLDEEIVFTTSLIPHLNLFDRVEVNYNASDFSQQNNLWDLSDWDTDFYWSSQRGDAIVLQNEPFKVLSISINLDRLETRFACRQLNE